MSAETIPENVEEELRECIERAHNNTNSQGVHHELVYADWDCPEYFYTRLARKRRRLYDPREGFTIDDAVEEAKRRLLKMKNDKECVEHYE